MRYKLNSIKKMIINQYRYKKKNKNLRWYSCAKLSSMK